MKTLPKPIKAWALARFRSSANACSHSAMPAAARLVSMSTSPRNVWPGAWSGTDDKALVNFASASAKAVDGSVAKDSPPSTRFFKHALVQETAYESLLKSRRQILHQQIAETLREKFPDIAKSQPELLAHHFTKAGHTAPAIEY